MDAFVCMNRFELVTLACYLESLKLFGRIFLGFSFPPLSSGGLKWHFKPNDLYFEPLAVDAVQYSSFFVAFFTGASRS